MTRVSNHFRLGKSQCQLDFVDVDLARDTKLFLDPFAISQRPEHWAREAHSVLLAYFQKLIDHIRSGNERPALELLRHLQEPNETRLGLSRGEPSGAGIGDLQARQLYDALTRSEAARTGFLSALEECELMVVGIGGDKISDMTTNIIRKNLIEYTQSQCDLHSIPVRSVAIAPCFDVGRLSWVSDYHELPVVNGRPVLLVPKSIVRYDPSYDHRRFYRHFALEYLKREHLQAKTGLVRALKNGTLRVYKTDLEAVYPLSKDYLFRFAKEHPEILEEYRDELARLEKAGRHAAVTDDQEATIARALMTALNAIPAGNERASDYHSFMVGALELVFFPVLCNPVKEHEINDGRKRIDILMENAAQSGIFERLQSVRRIPCSFVAFECKNYSRDIANPELDQMIGRFDFRRGEVGFICCRHLDRPDLFLKRCQDTFRSCGGVVVMLDDDTILRLLECVARGDRRSLNAEVDRLVNAVTAA